MISPAMNHPDAEIARLQRRLAELQRRVQDAVLILEHILL